MKETADAQESVQREQIIGILKEHQAGLPVTELCRWPWDQRRHVLYVALELWWPRGVEAKRLKALEENRKLKKLLAGQVLGAATLRELRAKGF